MNTKTSKLLMADLEVQTVRKNIKNIHIGVYPPNGRVRVAAPMRTTDETIRLIVLSKIPWIRKQRDKFARQERETQREYVTGESHHFMGQRYLLNVIQGPYRGRVELNGMKRMNMYVNPQLTNEDRARIMERFYRLELSRSLDSLVQKWEERLGVHANEVRIKRMKTKWGSANIKAKRIWLNLELAKKSPNCISYVVVHELTHLIEKNHSKRFKGIIESVMPNWRQYRAELNFLISGEEDWNFGSESVRKMLTL